MHTYLKQTKASSQIYHILKVQKAFWDDKIDKTWIFNTFLTCVAVSYIFSTDFKKEA